jgi:hypothetical protein
MAGPDVTDHHSPPSTALVPGLPAGESHPGLAEIKNKNLYRVIEQPKPKEAKKVETVVLPVPATLVV